jgi:hypothetical protein
MTGATLTWVNLKAADAHRATAVQANDAIANDMTSSATALIHQDYDLLRTLTRDPSFSDWQALSGSNDLKLSEQSGRAATMRDDWKQIFLDYDALFPNSFRRLELVDTNNNQPLAILSDGQWVDTAKLPRTIDKSEEGWFTVVSYLVNTALVTEPYTDGTGERVISVAAPLLGAGSHGAVVATFPLSQFDTATVVSGTALTNVAGVVDLTDGSVLSTGKDQYAVTPAMTADAVKRVKHAGGKSVHFVLNGKAYSVIAPVVLGQRQAHLARGHLRPLPAGIRAVGRAEPGHRGPRPRGVGSAAPVLVPGLATARGPRRRSPAPARRA